jgi:hypothetical protein
VSFEALGRAAFLDAVRDLVGEEAARPVAEPTAAPRQALVQAGVQFLEALAQLVAAAPGRDGDGQGASPLVATDARTGQPVLQLPLPSPEVLQRGAAALQTILQGVARPSEPPPRPEGDEPRPEGAD